MARLKAYTFIELELPRNIYDNDNIDLRWNSIDPVCTSGSNLDIIQSYANGSLNPKFHCTPCKSGTYSLDSGAMTGNIKKVSVFGYDFDEEENEKNEKNENSTGFCINCPIGGLCNDGMTRSRRHFYGFK